MYHVPEYVSEHIDIIKPTVHFNHRARGGDAPAKFRKREASLGRPSNNNGPKTNGQLATGSGSLATCDQEIVPDCLRALYSIDYTPVATDKNSYGIGTRVQFVTV
jgi:tripeptidyl-peptidase-1